MSSPDPSDHPIADTGMFRRFVEEPVATKSWAQNVWLWVAVAVLAIAIVVVLVAVL